MEIRFGNSPKEVKGMDTETLREAFLIDKMITDDTVSLTYSHYDRVIIGVAKPVNNKLQLQNDPELRADYFLERRELGIINVGGEGKVYAEYVTYNLNKLDCLYIGKGTWDVQFESIDAHNPAIFYLISTPAHSVYPVQFVSKQNAESEVLGSIETANERTIYRYIHENGIKSCQLVMGLTILNKGSVWNTMPPHTHTRRTEAYFYFDLPLEQTIFHFMGEPDETRHLLVANYGAVISPPWSIHAGCGTCNYSFIWGMAGENYTYSDMDAVAINMIL